MLLRVSSAMMGGHVVGGRTVGGTVPQRRPQAEMSLTSRGQKPPLAFPEAELMVTGWMAHKAMATVGKKEVLDSEGYDRAQPLPVSIVSFF